MKKWWQVILITVLIIVADQITKYAMRSHFFVGESVPILDGFFNLTYVRNKGAAFGFGASYHDLFRILMFLALPTAACIWLGFLIKGSLLVNRIQTISYTLILAGAIGNLIDRFYLGYVVDLFDFYWSGYHFPAFNIADSSISIAAALLFIEYIMVLTKTKVAKEKQ